MKRRALTELGARRKVNKLIHIIDRGWDHDKGQCQWGICVWCEDGWYDSETVWRTYQEAEKEVIKIGQAMILHLMT